MITLSHVMTLGGKSCDDIGTPHVTGGTIYKSMGDLVGHMMTLSHMMTLEVTVFRTWHLVTQKTCLPCSLSCVSYDVSKEV